MSERKNRQPKSPMRLSPSLHSSPRDLDTRYGSCLKPGGPCTRSTLVDSSRSIRSRHAMAPSLTSWDQQRGMLGWLRRTWFRSSHSSSTDADPAGQPRSSLILPGARPAPASAGSVSPAPTHLIVMVNGLFGSAANWDVIAEQLQQHLPPDTLLHPSQVNARWVVLVTNFHTVHPPSCA